MRGSTVVVLLGVVACGGPVGPIVGSDDIAAPFDGGLDSTVPVFDEGGADADADATKYVGGPFLCDECVCDGTSDMCFHAGGGQAPMDDDGGFGDASACMLDAGPSSCEALPIQCVLDPTCACILEVHPPPCTCSVDPSDNGFRVDCFYP